jgi:hypothetical protein
MDLKKIIGVLGFLVLGFMPKVIGQVQYQGLLIVRKDTFELQNTFITDDSLNLKITSKKEEMSRAWCMGGSYSPTWMIENDSIFLIELLDEKDMRKEPKAIDMAKLFKERYINGRIFAKELNYQIAAYYRTPYSDSIDNSNIQVCFTIKDGKVIDKGVFKYLIESENRLNTNENTDWENFPKINEDRWISVKIFTNDKGELVNALIVKNDLNSVKEGEEVWQQEALRQVKLVPKWDIYYECGRVIHKEFTIFVIFSKIH